MDTFEIRNSDNSRVGGDRSIKWKTRLLLGIVGAVAVIGFTTVLAHTFLEYYELQSNIKNLEVPVSGGLTDIQCEEEFCSTKGCLTTAARMLDIINVDANPCEDFYEYACGNYKKGRAPRFQEESYTPVKEAEENLIVILKKIMDKPISNSDSAFLKKTKSFFFSCTNTERRNNASLDDLRQFLINVNLEWPVLHSDWDEDSFDWKTVVRRLERSYGIHTLVRMHSEMSDDNPLGHEFIECKIPTLPAAAYLYENETDKPYIMKMYAELMDFVLRPLGVERNKRKEFIQEIISLETLLARSIVNSSEQSSERPSRELLQILEGNSYHFDEPANNVYSKCDGNINKLLEVLESQTERNIKNYLGWRTVYNVMRLLNSDMKELSDAYIGSFPGSFPIYSTRFRECGAAVRDEMGLMAAKAYLDAGYFTEQQETEVRGLMTEMKMAFIALLHTLPWMDNNTLSIFQDKLKRMHLSLGYPEDLRSDHVVDHLFHDLDVNENNTLFLNVMKVREHISNLRNSEHREHSVDNYPLSTRAVYSYINNSVDMKLGLLRPPVMIYGEDYPRYLKYAHAVPLAHEISHAFDTFGSLFNERGEQEGIDWWPDAVKQKFLGFVICLRQQEALRSGIDITDTEVKVINNDIADLGAFFITYVGLSLHLRLHGEEEKPLPGFTLTKKQTYLVQTAQMFCDLRDPRPTIDPYIKTSRTGKERVNSAISNFEDFGAIFDCPVGSPMNPAHKCNLLR